MNSFPESALYGINAVLEAIQSQQRACYKLVVDQEASRSRRLREIITLAQSQGIRIETLPSAHFDKQFRGVSHQGIVGFVAEKTVLSVAELIAKVYEKDERPTLGVLDSIQDPQNMGALIRSAAALNCQGLILPKRRSAPLNATVSKVSAGAIERIMIAEATNLSQCLTELKQQGFWIIGLDPRADSPCWNLDLKGPIAVVLGNEGKGIRPILKKDCDFLASIPMAASVESLNASAAGAAIFYEILRQKNERA
ncbi:MAG: 23S rRNA (guanosine(2251)-2'-O)-methyltransferase RlmB [Candidatus Nitrohelix vancouverensis]|uniref:23S rRNA (Guanosine(2251)-2'-O)-methyltransferase RlmB n=1 Tax=Candidatus Nitrohelix vancouverensis TaxID=2705534 RepID=A0A7T0G333_9BACT|nr:MAG: 23S rRNA (guanosine(2251)-2'-O)-methyltransferase RlmB [Candidatus Nitrohelix vancouverensis]